MSNHEVFDQPLIGTVNVGYYRNTVNQFAWSMTNDMAKWYFSLTFETWFKEEEIDFQ